MELWAFIMREELGGGKRGGGGGIRGGDGGGGGGSEERCIYLFKFNRYYFTTEKIFN